MVTQDYTSEKLLKSVVKAGVYKITASGVDNDFIRIEVYHNKGDKNNPIVSEVPNVHFYGDVVDQFELSAENAGFKPNEIWEVRKDVSNVLYEMGEVLIQHRDKQVREEVQTRKQQLIAVGILAEEPEGPHVEGQQAPAARSKYVDWNQPQSVGTCLKCEPGTVYTVFGQITAKNNLYHKVKGALYRCANCNMINHHELARPADIGDTEIPLTLHDEMCRLCARRNLDPKSEEYRAARTQHQVKPLTVNTVDIELTDTDRFDEVSSLHVILFGKDAEDCKLGEYVTLKGKHQTAPLSKRGGKSYPVCYAYYDSVVYKNQEAYKLTPKDIQRVKRFVELAKQERPIIKERDKDGKVKSVKLGEPLGEKNIIDRLVWMTGHNVIGCETAKEAILYTEASVGPDVIGKGSTKLFRQRLHTGLVGGPGSSKTTASLIPMLHDERNNFENMQSSTMKTLTAIASKEAGDNSKPLLRTGPIPQTKGAVLTMNEFSEVSMNDQAFVQDAMEEGQFTFNKMGIKATIRADTAIIWTGNPKQGADFSSQTSVDLNEIAVRKQVIDRTDLIVIMRPVKELTKRVGVNNRILQMHRDFLKDPIKRKNIRGYDEYTKRHLLYAKSLNPDFTTEAMHMLAQAEARIQQVKFQQGIPNAGSNRTLGTLERLSIVIAKLKLHEEITTEDAGDAVDFYNKISAEIHQSVDRPQDIAEYTAQTMIFILQNESNALSKTFRDLAELASAKDQSIKWYLYQGVKNKLGDVSTNKRMKRVLELLENVDSKKVRRVKQQPAEFLWVGGKK